jgi:hypothetical protein
MVSNSESEYNTAKNLLKEEKIKIKKQQQKNKLQSLKRKQEFKIKDEKLKVEAQKEEAEYKKQQQIDKKKKNVSFLKSVGKLAAGYGHRIVSPDLLSQFISSVRHGKATTPANTKSYGLTFRPTSEIIKDGTFESLPDIPRLKKMFKKVKRGQFFFLDLVMLILVFFAFVGIAPALVSVIGQAGESAGYDAFLAGLIGLFPAFILLCIFLSGLYIAAPFARFR